MTYETKNRADQAVPDFPGYNKRLQPLQILYTTSDSATAQSEVQNASCSTNSGDLFHKIYSFADSFAGVSGDNGNVAKITSCIDSNRSQNFSYDALNRINTAYTDGPNWGEQFAVDPWGNLTNITTTKGMGETLNAPVTALNRLSGWSYDAAGNQTSSSDPLGFTTTNSYDAESRLTSFVSTGGSAATYTYDGDGNRVLKNLGGTGTLYWGGTDGEILAESDLSGTLISEYVFFNGKRIARTDNPTDPAKASLKYYLSDHLGSTSMITDATFSTALEDEDYYPYGREVAGGGDDSNHYLFTGKERDAESGLDNFGARYDASSLGRFMSPDPGPFVWSDPQTFNRYAYTRNNPLKFIDPTGKYFVVAAEIRQQVQQYISTMLRSPKGAATINAIAASSKPVTFGLGSLPRTEHGNTISVTNGITVPVPGSHPGEVGGADVKLDNKNIAFSADKKGTTDFYMGLKTFAHEDQHVTDILGASTFQGAAAAGAAGDAPTQPGAFNTEGGSAEGRALDIMGELGAAGQNYQPDAQMDSLAAGILQQGADIQSGNVTSLINQAMRRSGCTFTSENGQVCH